MPREFKLFISPSLVGHETAEAFFGDLYELFTEKRKSRGVWSASLWYAVQVVNAVGFFIRHSPLLTYGYVLSFAVKAMLKRRLVRITSFAAALAATGVLATSFIHSPSLAVVADDPRVHAGVSLLLLAFSAVSFWSHRQQAHILLRHAELLRSLQVLTSEIGDSDLAFGDSVERDEYFKEFTIKVLATFNAAFEKRDSSICASILLLCPDRSLNRLCQYPSSTYNARGVVPVGLGAEGSSAVTGAMIYVPKVAHGHGIRIADEPGLAPDRWFSFQENSFQQFGATRASFQSLLCVPIKYGGLNRRKIRGVLCLSAPAAGAFSSDFYLDAAQLEANILAAVLWQKAEHTAEDTG
jgi:hypothetical protein